MTLTLNTQNVCHRPADGRRILPTAILYNVCNIVHTFCEIRLRTKFIFSMRVSVFVKPNMNFTYSLNILWFERRIDKLQCTNLIVEFLTTLQYRSIDIICKIIRTTKSVSSRVYQAVLQEYSSNVDQSHFKWLWLNEICCCLSSHDARFKSRTREMGYSHVCEHRCRNLSPVLLAVLWRSL